VRLVLGILISFIRTLVGFLGRSPKSSILNTFGIISSPLNPFNHDRSTNISTPKYFIRMIMRNLSIAINDKILPTPTNSNGEATVVIVGSGGVVR
jgi:hypothetical protein